MIDVRFVRLTDTAVTPHKAHESDAGYDICADNHYTAKPGEMIIVSTGISLEMPKDICAFVMSRSGLAAKHGVFVLNAPGLVDPGYRGEVRVILYNAGSKEVLISRGDRVAQLFFNFVMDMPEALAELQVATTTDRGENGLGSTGMASLMDDDGIYGVAV